MIVAEQLTWIATGLDLASAQADRLAAEVTTDPQARREVAADAEQAVAVRDSDGGGGVRHGIGDVLHRNRRRRR